MKKTILLILSCIVAQDTVNAMGQKRKLTIIRPPRTTQGAPAPEVTRQQAKASTLPSASLKTAVKVPGSLHDAAERGDLSRVTKLLDAGASANDQELNHSCFPYYNTPLHRAALEGHEAVARLLISRGALVNKPDGRGCTPLHLAAIRHHEKVALLLINHGADINQQAQRGSTPLHHAIFYGYEPFVRFLIDHGADINKPDNDGHTPLHCAVMNYGGTMGIARLLINHGALINQPDKYGSTPLHCAVSCRAEFNEFESLALLLVDHGADINQRNHYWRGRTPLQYAKQLCKPSFVALLQMHAAKVAQPTRKRFIAVFAATAACATLLYVGSAIAGTLAV